MAKKMYYNEEEASEQLGVDQEGLERLIADGRLHAYQDGQRQMFRTQDVDKLAEALASEQTGSGDEEEEIELSPADSAGGINLSEDTSAGGGKEDTVITSEGISVFDEEDLDVDSADPMAKTQIAPSLEDQQNLENVGTGSGLLDLTRESDDTSLGSEVLGQIDMEDTSGSQVVGSSIAEAVGESAQPAEQAPQGYQQVQPMAAAAVAPDSTAGLFSGFLAGCAILAVVLMSVVMAGMMRALPGYVEYMKENMMIVMGAAAGLLLIAAIIGYVVRKPSQTAQQG